MERYDRTSPRWFSNAYELLSMGLPARWLDALWTSASAVSRCEGRLDLADRGYMSEYRAFSILCTAMPLWAGHPLYAAAHRCLRRVLPSPLSMTAENAPSLWQACAEALSMDPLEMTSVSREVEDVATDHAAHDLCSEAVIAPMGDLCLDPLIRPSVVGGEGQPCLEDLSRELILAVEDTAKAGGHYATVTLPSHWRFSRPHPYLAQRSLTAMASGEILSLEEGCQMECQLLRVAGQALAAAGISLKVYGGHPRELDQLLAYLEGCDGLPTVIYLPVGQRALSLAEPYGDLCRRASLGLFLEKDMSREELAERWQNYAAHAPLGCMAVVDISPTVPCGETLRRAAADVLQGLLVAWGKEGRGPADAAWISAISARVFTQQ